MSTYCAQFFGRKLTWLDHKLTIIEHLQVQKIYLLDAHIFCEIHCPSLGKIDNIKSKTLQLGCDKLLVK